MEHEGYCEMLEEINKLRAERDRYKQLDSEAATYVESVICMRTHFTGDPPYVGWKGLGIALTETLDERDRLREALERLAGDDGFIDYPLAGQIARAALGGK